MEIGLYPAAQTGKKKITSFQGLNRTRKGVRGEFSDMLNMSAREYPCLAPQGGRLKVCEAESKICTVVAPDATNVDAVTGITGVCDGGFYYNGELKSSVHLLNPNWDWQIERKGNMYIINGYDKGMNISQLFYYCIDTDEFSQGGVVMNNLILTAGGSLMRTPYTDANGVYNYTVTRPDGTQIKNKDFYRSYKDYTTYDSNGNITMSPSLNIFAQYFEVGDEVTIEGFVGEGNSGELWKLQSNVIIPQENMSSDENNTIDTDNMSSTEHLADDEIVRAVVDKFNIRTLSKTYAHEIYFKLYNKNGDEVTFKDIGTNNFFCSGVTIKKRTKVLDNIAVHHGRIWGSAPTGNQIYASPSDDIFSFSADDFVNKYGVRIPSDTAGVFTAMCSYNNDLVAFKPDSITIISGTNPINYSSIVFSGVGCIAPKSVAVTPSGIIFLGYSGFYIYNGSTPQRISAKLNADYVSAVAGYDGTSYYASALRSDGVRELLVFDMRYGQWYKEDDISASGYFKFHNDFYICDGKAMYKTNGAETDDWSFTFKCDYDDDFSNVGINEVWLRAELSDGAEFWVETKSGDGEFVMHNKFTESGFNVYRCPVRLSKSDRYEIKVCGRGDVVFYEIELKVPEGGRRYKEY